MKNENFPDVAIIPKALGEAEEILREHAESNEWWMIVVDGYGFKLTEPIIRKQCPEAPPDDYFAVAIVYGALAFTVVCLRRRRMLANKYRYLLSKQGVNITERELLEGGALIRVGAKNEPLARKFAMTVLGCSGVGEKGSVAKIR